MKLSRKKSAQIPERGCPEHAGDRHVFAYGTLRHGGSNDIAQLAPAPCFVGRGVIGGTLYDLGSYPGLVLGRATVGATRTSVVGEVYLISQALERRLDEIEGLAPVPNGEYIKREVPVEVAGNRVVCIVYEITSSQVKNKQVITSGDWLQHLSSTGSRWSPE